MNKNRQAISIYNFFTKGGERSINAKKNIVGTFFLRGISILVSFILVPLTINYLDTTEYGIWLTLSSILLWIDFFDIGIGHGLRNRLAEALTVKDYKLGKQYVSSAFAFLSILSVGMYVVFLFINPFLNWDKILNIDVESGRKMSDLVTWVAGFFCLRFIFKIVGIILVADQKPAKDTLLNVIANIISFIIIYILTKTTDGSLFLTALSLSCTTPLVFAVASIYLFKKDRYKKIAPSFKDVKVKYLNNLLGLGMKFFIIQLSCLLIFSSTNFIIIQFFGPEEVTIYNIAYKYFSILIIVFTIIVTPLWTAFTDAYANKDLIWIKNTTNKIKIIFLISTVLTVIFILFANFFYKIWVGDSIKIPFSVTLSVGIYTILYNLLSTYNYVVNGVGKVYVQMIISILTLIIYLPIAFIFSKLFGLSGAINATSLMLIPLIIVAYIQYQKIISNKLTGVWNK